MEAFQLLFEEKYFYLNAQSKGSDFEKMYEAEERKIKNISNKYHLDNIYYSLDNDSKNIYKRMDRYYFKIRLTILFSILVAFNLFEIVVSLLLLTVLKSTYKDFDNSHRIFSPFVSISNILATLLLTSMTINKLKIQTYIFY